MHDWSPSSIHQYKPGLAARKLVPTQQVLRLLGQGRVHRDEIGSVKELVQVNHCHTEFVAPGLAHIGIPGDNRHFPPFHAECHGAPDAPEANDSQCRAPDAPCGSRQLARISSLSHRGIEARKVAHAAQHEGDGVVGDVIRAVGGRIADHDAVLCGGLVVDGIVPRAGANRAATTWQPGEHLSREQGAHRLYRDHDGVSGCLEGLLLGATVECLPACARLSEHLGLKADWSKKSLVVIDQDDLVWQSAGHGHSLSTFPSYTLPRVPRAAKVICGDPPRLTDTRHR